MRKLVFLALASLLVSCGDDALGPDRLAPDSRSDGISDANHGALEDRNPGFWWLPPMVPNPTVNGTFQPAASPRMVVVCHYSSLGDPCDPTEPIRDGNGAPAVFTRGAGLMAGSDQFQVNFDTRAWSLRTTSTGDTTTYRVIVYTDPLEAVGGPFVLGSADIQLAASGGAAKNLAMPDSMIALNDGRTLPMKFYLNERAYPHELAVNTEPAGEDALCQENCSVTFLPATEDTTEASLVDDETGEEVTAVQFPSVNGDRVLIIDERQTEGAEADCAPGRVSTKTSCFRYEITGGPLDEEFRFGVCPEGVTFGQGIWQLTQVRSDGSATAHGDVDVSDFLPCEGNDGSGSGPISMLRPLLDRLVAPLYAEDTRRWGGRAEDFSDFFWEVPAEMSSTNAPAADTVPGSTETFTVVVHATHGVQHGHEPEPLGGVDVTFAVTDGAATLGGGTTPVTSLTVATDANGEAAATLTVADGPSTLVVSSTAAAGGPITFTRTGNVETVTVLSSQLPLAAVGSPVTLDAAVSPAPPAGSTVEFFEAGNSIGTATTNSDGVASLGHVLGSALETEAFTASFAGVPGYQPSGSATSTQHKYQPFSDLTSFGAALGDAATESQDFSGFDTGTPVTDVIPGVLTATSSFPDLAVSLCSENNCLFGGGGTTRQDGDGRYALHFAGARNALAFQITAQDPNAPAATVQVFTGGGSVSLAEANQTGDETQPNFFGIILTLPIDSVALLEPPEVSGTGNEEVGLDEILVAYTLGATLESVDLSGTTLTIDGSALSFTAVMRNPTGAPLSTVVLQNWIEQGDALRAGGGSQVLCGAGTGVLPAGECVMNRSISASNAGSGSGTLVPGPAVAVIDLEHNDTVIDQVRIPVTLQ